jgi:hypothetical protein
MLKKFSTEALAMIGSLTVFAGSVYNTERITYNNTKNVQLAHEFELQRNREDSGPSGPRIRPCGEDSTNKLEILALEKENTELKIALETLKQSNLNQSESSSLKSTNQVESVLAPGGGLVTDLGARVAPHPEDDLPSKLVSNLNEISSNINQSSFFIVDNSTFMNFSTSIILNSMIGLSAVISLMMNYYIQLYGDKYKDKLPKWSLPLLNFYMNFTIYSNRYYIMLLVLTQGLNLMIGIYLKYRNLI